MWQIRKIFPWRKVNTCLTYITNTVPCIKVLIRSQDRSAISSTYQYSGEKGSTVPGDAPASHYNDVIMGTIASQITSLTIVYSTVYSDSDQRKHQSHASLAFVRGIHRGPVNSPHKWPVTRKMFPFDDVFILPYYQLPWYWLYEIDYICHLKMKKW